MSDVTIPADVARDMAATFRALTEGRNVKTSAGLRGWADLLDPRPVSLRDEVAEKVRDRRVALANGQSRPGALPLMGATYVSIGDGLLADAVLAVVRRRIEALRPKGVGPFHPWADPFDAVLALFDEDGAR